MNLFFFFFIFAFNYPTKLFCVIIEKVSLQLSELNHWLFNHIIEMITSSFHFLRSSASMQQKSYQIVTKLNVFFLFFALLFNLKKRISFIKLNAYTIKH